VDCDSGYRVLCRSARRAQPDFYQREMVALAGGRQ